MRIWSEQSIFARVMSLDYFDCDAKHTCGMIFCSAFEGDLSEEALEDINQVFWSMPDPSTVE